MTKNEAEKSKSLLSGVAQRVETVAVNGGGVAVTAHWNDGGSKLFYDFNTLRDHMGLEPTKPAKRKGW